MQLLKKAKFPSWLNPDELEQAKALIDLGFHFCGDRDRYCVNEDMKMGKVGQWQFYTSRGGVVLDVVIKGALYSKCLELLDLEEEQFKQEVKRAKSALRKVIDLQKQRQPKQLSILNFKEV